jgi:hypothetical protein
MDHELATKQANCDVSFVAMDAHVPDCWAKYLMQYDGAKMTLRTYCSFVSDNTVKACWTYSAAASYMHCLKPSPQGHMDCCYRNSKITAGMQPTCRMSAALSKTASPEVHPPLKQSSRVPSKVDVQHNRKSQLQHGIGTVHVPAQPSHSQVGGQPEFTPVVAAGSHQVRLGNCHIGHTMCSALSQ